MRRAKRTLKSMTLYDLVSAYADVTKRYSKGMEAMEKAQRDFWEAKYEHIGP